MFRKHLDTLRRERGPVREILIFFVQLVTCRMDNLTGWSILLLLYMCDHAYTQGSGKVWNFEGISVCNDGGRLGNYI